MTDNNGLPTYTPYSGIVPASDWDIARLREAILSNSEAYRHVEDGDCHSIRFNLKGTEFLIVAPNGGFVEGYAAAYYFKMPDMLLDDEVNGAHDCGLSTLMAMYRSNYPWPAELEDFARYKDLEIQKKKARIEKLIARAKDGDERAAMALITFQMFGKLPDDDEPQVRRRGTRFGQEPIPSRFAFGNDGGDDDFLGGDGESIFDLNNLNGGGDDDDEAFFADEPDDDPDPETGEDNQKDTDGEE